MAYHRLGDVNRAGRTGPQTERGNSTGEMLPQRRLARDAALREAQRYVRDLSVGEICDPWLTPAMIDRLAGDDEDYRNWLLELAQQSDDNRPFLHPFYWGAFICQGETRPLKQM